MTPDECVMGRGCNWGTRWTHRAGIGMGATTLLRYSNARANSDTARAVKCLGRGLLFRVGAQYVSVSIVVQQLTELRIYVRARFRFVGILEVRHIGTLGRVNLVCHVSLQKVVRRWWGAECTPAPDKRYLYPSCAALPQASRRAALHVGQSRHDLPIKESR
jgi:hypothetical protein